MSSNLKTSRLFRQSDERTTQKTPSYVALALLETRLIPWALFCLLFTGCTSVFHQPGSEVAPVYSKVFLVDYNATWQATVSALRSYEKSKQNRSAGMIQTTWIDNTAVQNYIEAYGDRDTFLRARFRLTVAVSPGATIKGKPTVRVSVEKEQQIQRDALEGWKTVSTDSIEENALLYRIGTIIRMSIKLSKEEKQKLEEAVQEGV